MEVRTSIWSSTKCVKWFAMKGCTLPPRESVNARFSQGTRVAPSPPTPNKYALNASLNLGEPALMT
ncbi:MAG: hypothetical protein ACKPKO_41390, partial [Candidatus Fonsibacter sp.]